MLLTSEQNKHIWGLHQAVLLYFLMSSMPNFILNKISNKTQHNCYKWKLKFNVCGMGYDRN